MDLLNEKQIVKYRGEKKIRTSAGLWQAATGFHKKKKTGQGGGGFSENLERENL